LVVKLVDGETRITASLVQSCGQSNIAAPQNGGEDPVQGTSLLGTAPLEASRSVPQTPISRQDMVHKNNPTPT